MKILFIFHETNEHNGAWKSGYLLLKELRKRGVELFILTPDGNEIYKILKRDNFNVKSIKIVYNDSKNIGGLKYKIYRIPFNIYRKVLSIFWWFRVSRVIKQFNPDLIHTNSSVFYLGFDIAKYYKIPHVWHIREFGDLDFNLKIYETKKRLAEHVSYNICITKCILEGRGLMNDKRSYVIYNGINRKSEVNYVFPKKNYFLYVGSLNDGKGIKDIIDAWIRYKELFSDESYDLRFVGGTEEDIIKWQKYTLTKGVSSTIGIVFMGMRNDVKELMSNAKALIVASFNEAFGRVTAEAMFAGCMVIGRDTAGTKEQFDNGLREGGEIGIRFTTSEELSEKINQVSNMDVEQYETIVQRAQNTVKKLYSIESYADKVYRLYMNICDLK